MPLFPLPKTSSAYLAASGGGISFAFLIWRITGLETRFALAAIAAILLLAGALIFMHRIDDLLVYAFVANIPFAAFEKWIYVIPVAVPAKGLTMGLSELLILIAYTTWFCGIFISRTRPFPSFTRLDLCVALLFLTQLISLVGAPDKSLAAFDIVYNLRHFLIYFFIAHHVERRHLRLIIVLFLGAILLQTTIAVYERTTGNVGIGLSKGNAASEDFARQYQVPGSEEYRAAGTTSDSHALALYYSMVLPVPFVLMLMPHLGRFRRLIMAVIFTAGCAGLIVTFSRAGWLSFVASCTFASIIMLAYWKRLIVIPAGMGIFLLIMAFFPNTVSYVRDRISNAPPELLELRYDSYRTALDIWKGYPLFGYGPGNYIEALSDHGIRGQTLKGDWDVEVPVHNAFLWVAAELGMFGVIFFFGMILVTMFRAFPLMNNSDPVIKGMGLALLTAFIAYLLDGLTDPMFREATVYMQLWLFMGLISAIRSFIKPSTDTSSPDTLPGKPSRSRFFTGPEPVGASGDMTV